MSPACGWMTGLNHKVIQIPYFLLPPLVVQYEVRSWLSTTANVSPKTPELLERGHVVQAQGL